MKKKAKIKRPTYFQRSIYMDEHYANTLEGIAQAHDWTIARAVRECVMVMAEVERAKATK